jgi:MOSC domain-containing protein YiiM
MTRLGQVVRFFMMLPRMKTMSIAAIYLNTRKDGPMTAVQHARAIAGRGLEGNRYQRREGDASGHDREVTLIESEAIDAVRRDDDLPLEPHETRRNLVTRGVPLNHLVGREFRVGGATLRGIRLCEPCSHLESLTRPGLMKALVHRGGLRAQIVSDGLIQVGDGVEM